ncbi:MAG: hypothetical protein ABIO81_07175, partial [Ginsengibacter sp.]
MNKGTNNSESFYYSQAVEANSFEKNAEEYPYSSLTRYLLLLHYKTSGHPGFEELVQKTALYFNNHHWLQFQLSQIETEHPGHIVDPQSVLSAEFKEGNNNQNHFAVITEEELEHKQQQESITGHEGDFATHTQTLESQGQT